MTDQSTQSQPSEAAEETQVEVVIDDAPTQDGHQETQEETPRFDPVRGRVDFSKIENQDVRHQVESKVGNLYKQVKMSDQRNALYWDIIQKQENRLKELEGRFEQTDQAEAERTIQARLSEARDEGDIAKENRILQELIDFRVESKMAAKKPANPKSEPHMMDPDAHAVMQLAQETDDSGNYRHGWIASDHPKHAAAVKMAAIMATEMNASEGYIDIPTIIERVTQNMSQPPRQPVATGNNRAPDPMRGSNLTKNPNQVKLRLTSQEAAIAKKMGLSPEKYAKAKEKWTR